MNRIKYDKLPVHMQGGAKVYIECGISPGEFMLAVLENKFVEAFMHADDINAACMRDWADWLYNDCPGIARGDPQTVNAWIGFGGMEGLAQKRIHELVTEPRKEDE